MSESDDKISKLLRLKRYEQQSPEYFEEFLREFQRRQRVELLKRPAWRLFLDRFEAYFAETSLSQLSYAGASVAVVLIAGAITLNLLDHPGSTAISLAANSAVPAARALLASQNALPTPASAIARNDSAPASYTVHDFTLDPQIQLPDVFQNQRVQPGATNMHPRYILDARPVSYEPKKNERKL